MKGHIESSRVHIPRRVDHYSVLHPLREEDNLPSMNEFMKRFLNLNHESDTHYKLFYYLTKGDYVRI